MEVSCLQNLRGQRATSWLESQGLQEGGVEEVELGPWQGLEEVAGEVEVQGNQHCCQEEEEETLETAPAGHRQAAILVWS